MPFLSEMLRRLGFGTQSQIAVPVTFYTRAGCHLCDEALELLRTVARRAHILPAVEVIDIDQYAELIGRYGDKVPVLVIGGKERLWGRINPVLLRRTLEGEAAQVARLRKAGGAKRSSAEGAG